MSKFYRPNKVNLQNAQHFSFMEAFLTVVGAYGFQQKKIMDMVALLTTAFREEDRWFMIARASELIAQRAAADRRRTNLYSRLHMLVRLWAGSGSGQLDDAATRLMRVFRLYKLKTNAQMDAKSGDMENLIGDLSTEEMQADISLIGGTWLFEQMVAAHQQMRSMRMEEGVKMSQKVRGALVAARKRCDELYDELTYLIEAFAKTADDATPFEVFIKRWNGSLKLYQEILDRKSNSSVSISTEADGDTGLSDEGN